MQEPLTINKYLGILINVAANINKTSKKLLTLCFAGDILIKSLLDDTTNCSLKTKQTKSCKQTITFSFRDETKPT